MALKTTVRMGGDPGATVIDYTDQIPLWELNEDGEHQSIFDVGMQCDNGNASQWQFTVDDDLGEIPKADLTKNLPAFTRVTVSEDAPGFECVLAYGRIARKDIGRGTKDFDDARQFRVTVNDLNFDLTDLDLVEPWVRPSESGRTRVLAAITAFLSGSPRLTTDIENHLVAPGGEVTMPAHTYPAGTTMIEILNDCATVEGKLYALVVHHDSGASHPCFLYIDEGDHTTFASDGAISDDPTEIDPLHATAPVWPPIWDQGPASLEDGDADPISHLVSKYGASEDSYVVASDSARVTSYDYRARAYNDSKSETEAQAQTRANAVLTVKSREHVTHQVTVKLRADQVDFLCAGMSIDIKSAASMGGLYLGTTQTRRIAEIKWEPISPEAGSEDGWYNAHLQLDRAVRVLPEGKGSPVGPKPPVEGTPGTVTTYESWDWDSGEETVANIYTPDLPGPVQMLIRTTAVGPEGGAGGTSHSGGFGSSALSTARVAATAGTTYRFFGYAQFFGESWPYTAHGRVNGSWGVKWYTSGGSLIRTDTIGSYANVSQDGPFRGPDEIDLIAPANTAYFRMATGTDSTLQGQTLSNKIDQVVISVVGAAGTSGTTPPSLGGPGEGQFGDSDYYLPADSVIEHGDLSDKGGIMHDASQIEAADPGGYFDGETVAAQLQEIGAALDTGTTTPTVVDHGAMGATETFDASEGSDHEGTLDANLTVTLSGATDGEAAWMTLKLLGDGTNTITWPGSVVWPGGVEPDPPADGEVLVVSLFSYDGGSNWYGSYPGTATSSGGSGGLPLTAVVNGEPVLLWDENNSLIGAA